MNLLALEEGETFATVKFSLQVVPQAVLQVISALW
jgi:hypothetical protein